MQSTTNSRKRPAPGTSPLVQNMSQQQLPTYPYSSLQDQQTDFGTDFLQPYAQDQVYSDPAHADDNGFAAFSQNAALAPTYGGSSALVPSTDLVRRSRNQIIGPQHVSQQEQWNLQNGGMNARQQPGEEDEAELTLKVQAAKRDAQGKRKQIPPFVQKLSSFLDSNNTDLIRWSDDGRSFIVLDEDEFARTLIPELFKHNNYASFVRQLNMYGFHKTVNITDGSLRQSEKARKGVKPPSMYSHPYFRKNRPDLLWLIQKPTNKSSAKRKREGSAKEAYDSDDERQYSPGPEGRTHETGALGVGQDLATLPRNELTAVRTELQKLQQQQRFISKMITQLKEQNDQFYRQATAFQALHDRHENSINAILTFLATFYNRSLDGTGAANLVNMFNSHQQQAQHGSVVEEFHDTPNVNNAQLQRYVKKTPLLLGAPSPATQSQSPLLQTPNSSTSHVAAARQSTTPPYDKLRPESSKARGDASTFKPADTASPVPKDEAETPPLQQIPESDQMMSLINSVNATNASTPNTSAPTFDFTSALDHYQNANGNAPLTPQQRENVLALMASQNGDASNNNALISPQPPTMPDLNQFKQTQQQLEMLTNMQRQQDDRVQELNRRLQPLSPTGSIPGLAHGADENPFDFTGNPGDYDPSNFFDFGSSAPDNTDIDFNFPSAANANTNGVGDVNNWDFTNPAGLDEADMFGEPFLQNDPATTNQNVDDNGAEGRVESLSSEATSPAGTVPEDPGTPRKRARRS